MANSTERLRNLLEMASEEDLQVLAEYLFGKGCQKKTVDEIIAKLRYYGSNDIKSLIVGRVHYLTIVKDIAEKMNVNKNSIKQAADEEQLEVLIVLAAFKKVLKKMSPADRKRIQKEIEDSGFKGYDFQKDIPWGAVLALITSGLGAILIRKITAFIVLVITREMIVGGVAARLAQRVAGVVFGPIGVSVSIGWIIADIAGPAYRKTIPAVLHIAFIKQNNKLAQMRVEQ